MKHTPNLIPFFSFEHMHREAGCEIRKAIERVVCSENYILGVECEKFEKEFAEYIGCEYAVGLNSGSDALFLTLKAAGIKEGDEVITVSNTFISTVDAIIRNGATAVLADIDPETYCIDTEKIESLISDKTKAIVPVHLYGQPAEMDRIIEVAEKHGLKVIEDACQSHGAKYKNQKVGAIHTAGCFSFYPTKNLGCFGDGGMITTNDEDFYKRILMLRNYGQDKKYLHDIQGFNSRLDEIQAGILRSKLKHLDKWNSQRREIAGIYSEQLEGTGIKLPVTKAHVESVYHLYVIRTKDRDRLKGYLSSHGIQTLIHYPVPIHKQKGYREFVEFDNLDVTESVCNEILSLPIFPGMTGDDIHFVVKGLRNAGL